MAEAGHGTGGSLAYSSSGWSQGARIGPFTVQSVLSRRQGHAVVLAQAADEAETAPSPRILKILERSLPSAVEIERIQRDWERSRTFRGPGMLTPLDIGSDAGLIYLVYDRGHWESLADRLMAGPLPALAVARLGAALAAALERLHREGQVHRNINPDSIVLEPGTDMPALCGFGYMTGPGRDAGPLTEIRDIAGDLGFVAPEQTGRIERPIDFRADFYALGATLYQALTGMPPFAYADAAEAIYCHLALDPPPPAVRMASAPEHLSDLILKLLHKDPEARYQSHRGLVADLETCAALLAEGVAAPFTLARQERPERLMISGRTYGRRREQAQVAALCQGAVAGAGGVALVAGAPGIGKTDLVLTARRSILRDNARFSSVKLERDDIHHAFAAARAAVGRRLRQILRGPVAEREAWTRHIADKVGRVLPAIAPMVPEIAALFGDPGAVSPLPPLESKNRLVLAFSSVLPALAREGHAWILFLDDLQWLDHASLGVLQQIVERRELGHFAVLGAYRSTEVGAGHPLTATIEEVARGGDGRMLIALEPLTREHVEALVADTLRSPGGNAAELAAFSHAITRGNPFHLKRLLAHLDRKGAFEALDSGWCWRGAAHAADLPGDIVSLLLADAGRLAPPERFLFEVASCLGEGMTADELALAAGLAPEAVGEPLAGLVAAGLLRPSATGRGYTFVHDRVREAAETLVDRDARDRLRLAIGRRLAAACPPGEALDFPAVDHLNAGRRFITEDRERDVLARHNEGAARRAAEACAFELAAAYAAIAVELDAAGPRPRLLTPRFLAFAARMALIGGKPDDADRLLALGDRHAGSARDRAAIAEVRIEACYAQDRLADAVALGIATFRDLSVALPAPADLKELVGMAAALRDDLLAVGVAEALRREPMAEGDDALHVALAAKITAAAYIAKPELLPILTIFQCRRMLEGGPVASAMSAFAVLGLMIAEFLGDYRTGYAVGRAADEEVRLRGWRSVEAHVGFSYNTFLRHWCEPLANTLDGTMQAHRNGVEHGNYRHAGLALHLNGYHSFLMGEPLPEVAARIEGYIATLRGIRQPVPIHYLSTFRQAVDDLAAPLPAGPPLGGPVFERAAMEAAYRERGDMTGMLFVHAVAALVHAYREDRAETIAAAEAAEPLFPAGRGMIIVPVTLFHQALARMALAREAEPGRRAELMALAEPVVAKFGKWAALSPNHVWRERLLRAAAALAQGDAAGSVALAREAAMLAARARCWPDLGLAQRWLARAHAAAGSAAAARRALAEARLAFLRWGATGLADRIEQEMLTASGERAPSDAPEAATLVKIAQAISDDLRLDLLTERLLVILRETAGARTACLVLDTGGAGVDEAGGWQVAGWLAPGAAHVDRTGRSLDESADDLPVAAIVDAIQCGTSALIEPGEARGLLPKRLRQASALSAMCLPLAKQGTVIGALYLENDRVEGLFSAERVEFLELMSGQIVNAIENARLYGRLSALTDELEARVVERTRQLQASEARMRAAFANLPIPTFISRIRDGKLLFANPRGAALFGLSIEEVLGEKAADWYVDRADRERVVDLVQRLGRFTDLELRLRDRRGAVKWVMMSGEAFDFDGEAALLATLIDVTERRRKDMELSYRAEHDALTGLFNRPSFAARAAARLTAADDGAPQPLALFYFDLDRFKSVNDTFGHAAGDALLAAFADRLRGIVPADAINARLGGDEFVTMCGSTPEEAIALARRINSLARQPYEIGGDRIMAPTTIGIACPAEPGESIEALMRRADIALYRAKTTGRDRFRLFEPGMLAMPQQRFHLTQALERALAEQQFTLAYQPVVQLRGRALRRVEALLRWQSAEFGPIGPALFIPAAEESGLIVPIGAWVLARACADAATLPREVGVSVNVSPAQLRSGTLAATVQDALSAAGLAPGRLTLEITESLLLADADEIQSELQGLKEIGVRLALDDFGAGHAGLGYLRQFPVDEIKIDRSFVARADSDGKAAAIVAVIAGLARGLDLDLVAEGIETEAQLRAVLAAGCAIGQGFLFGRPVPLAELCQRSRRKAS